MGLAAEVVRAVAERTPLRDPAVARTTVGPNLVLVEVRDRDPAPEGPGSVAGVAHRPPGTPPAVPGGADAHRIAAWAGDPPGSGADAGGPGDDPDERVGRALGLATLNALSAPVVDWRRGDPFESLPPDARTVATVGLFGPALRKFEDATVRVVERDPVDPPAGPPGVTVETYTPDGADRALAGADVLFLTGSALIYGGADRYLSIARERSGDGAPPAVVMVGATASFVPDPAFRAGVDALAGARVTDPGAVRAGIRAGDCAGDLHGAGLEKVFVADDADPG